MYVLSLIFYLLQVNNKNTRVSNVNFDHVIAGMVITWVPIHCSSVTCLSFEFFDKHGSKGKLSSRSTTSWKLNEKNHYM